MISTRINRRRITGKRFTTVTALVAAFALVLAGLAMADTVHNTIDASVDTNLETVNFAAGSTTPQTVTLRLTASNNTADGMVTDPQSGCNLGGNVNDALLWQGGKTTGAAALKLTATSSNTAVATVTSPAAFTDCASQTGYEQTMSVTPVGSGTTTVTFAIDSDNSKWRVGSTTHLAQASFTVTVAASADPCVTATVPAAPVFSAGAPNGDNGWHKTTVPAAGATSTTASALITYSTDNGETFSATVPTLGQGTTTVIAKATAATCATKSSQTSRTFKVDTLAPTVSVTGVADGSEYTLGAVPTVGCDTTDGTSGVADSATLGSSGGPVGSITATCSGGKDNAGNTAGDVSATYSVLYDWEGFFRPIDNGAIVNTVKAGSAVPVKFSLDGYQGDGVITSVKQPAYACTSGAQTDAIETTTTAGNSTLQYDALSDTYTWVWKTDKAQAGTCRTLTVALADGSVHEALFKLTK